MKRDFWGKIISVVIYLVHGTKVCGARGLKEHEDYFRAEDIGLSGHTIPANLDAYYPVLFSPKEVKPRNSDTLFTRCILFRLKISNWVILSQQNG